MFVCSECGGQAPAGGACPTDGTPLSPIGEDVLLGTTIGAYRVARLLGIGGMGRVYKGVHPTIGSRVAIKVLSRECTDRRDLVDRFFAEARAVNLIRHESIVNVLDLSVLPDGRPYIIMEYLDGAPLASVIELAQQQGTPLPLGGLARLCVEVLDALGAAHAKGIVHRDLKPDNIFVTPSGRPKVLDFGIARFTDPGSGGGSTRTGSLLGTPHYMSPEQAAGRPVDHRADLYAMGVILFECATGHKPFAAESLFDLLRKHVEEPPPSPRSFRPELAPPLEQVILCALAKAPDQRFATAQAMSMALQHATAQLPPDQWTPITGSGAHRTAQPSGWQHTPPQSWGGAGPSRAHPRPSQQPFPDPPSQPPQQSPISNLSTVSASSGQVQRQAPAKKSRAGLFLGLGAVVLLAGVGGTIAVVNSDGESSTAAAGEPPADESGSGSAGSAVATAPAGEGDPDDDAIDKQLEAQIQQQLGSAAAQLEELEKLKKLPVAEQKKRIEEMARKLPGAPQVAQSPTAPAGNPPAGNPTTNLPKVPAVVEADDPDDDDPDPPPGAPKDWLEERTITPGGWNPKRVDVAAFVKFAMAEAKKAVPDAQLTRIGMNGVTPDGFANLELPTLASDTGDIELRFISPSRGKPDPKTPVGLPVKLECEFRIMGDPSGVEIRKMFATNCKERAVPLPKCGALALWKLALAAKAPSNAVANISYYQASMHGTPRFFFDIGFGHDVVFSKVFTNADCP